MRFLLLASLLLIPFPAAAQMQDPILTLPDGQVILNINATVREEVEQDLLVATLQYSAEGPKPRDIQNEVNEAMAKAIKEAKKENALKVNTGAYNVYERTDPRTKERKWFAQQTLTIKSKNSEAVLTMTGKLQDMGLKVNGLNYMLDPKTAVSVQDSLLEEAVQQLQTRADRVAKAMNKSGVEIKELNTQSSIPYPQPMRYARGMAMAMESADMAAPVAEAGEDTITMTVNGRVILKP